jgi:hypothetical protein
MDEQAHGAVVQALALDACSPKTLARIEDELKGTLQFSQILHILIRLVGKGYARPCQKKEAAEKIRSRCASMTRDVLRQSATSDRLRYLVSPETGGGVALSREARLLLQDLALALQPQEAGLQQTATAPAEACIATILPVLRSLGIVEGLALMLPG